jgi:hypothetical protein
MCARDPLEAKCKGIRGVGEIADKEADTVHTINIISQRQYVVARCLSSYCGYDFGLQSIFFLPWSRSSSVSIVSDYGLNNRSSIPDRGIGFFF